MGKMSRMALAGRARRIVEALSGHWTCHSDTSGAMCCCPAHDDRTPSLSVRLGTSALLFKCFGQGCSASDIIAALKRRNLWEYVPGEAEPETQPDTPASPKERKSDLGAAALGLWRRSQALAGTLAQAWLLSRHHATLSPELRYLARCPLGRGESARFYPAMIAAVRNELGLVAIQRTFLSPDGRAKATMTHPRRMLGYPADGAVRLFPAGPVLGLAEGTETSLAAAHLLGIPVWATLGTERLGQIAIPQCVQHVVLLPDTGPSAVNQTAAALESYAERGISASCFPLEAATRDAAIMPVTHLLQDQHDEMPPQSCSLSDWDDLLRLMRGKGMGPQVTGGMLGEALERHLEHIA
jgi:putative DNA primase/helicase